MDLPRAREAWLINIMSDGPANPRRSMWIMLGLAALPFGAFPLETIGRRAFYLFDLQYYFFPYHKLAADVIKSGQLPLWNPYTSGGMPLFGDGQVAVLYPPNWVFLAFNPAHALSLVILANFSIAGVGMFALLRELKFDRAAAAIGALTFMFTGWFAVQVSHLSIPATAALTPWIFWSFERALRRRDVSSIVVAASSVMLSCFAGHPQMPVYCGVALGVYALTIAIQSRTPAPVLVMVMMYVMGGLLAAVQLWPWFELSRFSPRTAGTPYEIFASNSIGASDLPSMIFPFVHGGFNTSWLQTVPDVPWLRLFQMWERAPYVGVIPLALAILGLLRLFRDRNVSREHRRVWPMLAVLIALALVASAGSMPFGRLMQHVPLLGQLRAHGRATLMMSFALAVFVAFGVQSLSRRRGIGWREIVATGTPLVAAVVVLAWVHFGFSESMDDAKRVIRETLTLRNANAYMPLVFTIAGAIAILLLARRVTTTLHFTLAALIGVELIGFAVTFNPTVDAAAFDGTPGAVKFLRDEKEPFRVAIFVNDDKRMPDVARNQLIVSWAMAFGIEDINGFNSLQPRRVVDFLQNTRIQDVLYGFLHPNRMSAAHRKPLDALNVKYALLQAGYDWTQFVPEDWPTVYEDEFVRVIRNPAPVTRAFFAERVSAVAGGEKALATFHISGFDPLRDAVVEREGTEGPMPDLMRAMGGDVALVTRSVNSQVWRTNLNLPRLLVLSETWFPGWRASFRKSGSNDAWHELPIYRTNYLFRGIPVPPGDNEVRLVYRPSSAIGGAVVSLLTVIAAISACVIERRRRARLQQAPE